MFNIAQEILQAESTGNSWDWEDFEALAEIMEEDGRREI